MTHQWDHIRDVHADFMVMDKDKEILHSNSYTLLIKNNCLVQYQLSLLACMMMHGLSYLRYFMIVGPPLTPAANLSRGKLTPLNLAPKLDPDLVTVGNLVFRPHQLVRVELSSSDIAADEAKYAAVLDKFLARAQAERQKINSRSDQLQVSFLIGE